MTKSLNPVKEQKRLHLQEHHRIQDLGFILTLVGAAGYTEEARRAANTCKTLRLDDELWLPILKEQGLRHPLLYAISKQDEKRMRWICDHMHFPCTQVDADGHGALWYCIRYALAVPFIHFFCSRGASVHQVDARGQPALFYAIANRGLPWIKALLEEGSERNYQCKEGMTPLYVAARDGHCAVIRALCDAGSDATESAALFRSVRYGHAGAVQELLERGGSLDAKDPHHHSLLHYAAQFNHPTLCTYLLEFIEVDCLSANQVTPFMLAPSPAVWKILFEAGAALDQRDTRGWTALHYGVHHRRPEIIRLLLEYGADKNAMTYSGLTPLLYATLKGHTELEQLFEP